MNQHEHLKSAATVNTEVHAPNQELSKHVSEGLSAPQKFLASSWFYDDEGSRLFQQIMALPEYYLTRTEHGILRAKGDELASWISPDGKPIRLIELGSGDGEKTLTICEGLARHGVTQTYYPMDISAHALNQLQARFRRELPEFELRPVLGDYFASWPQLDDQHQRQVAMFLGSNMGNMAQTDAEGFLTRIRRQLHTGDCLLLGLDLKKDPEVILRAYSDTQGITAKFNLNLLTRLNRELGMNFEREHFSHYATYSPLDGAARSFLVSKRRQLVSSQVLARDFTFQAGETIYTEMSQKYSRAMIDEMAVNSGFSVQTLMTDPQAWYAIVVCKAN